MTDHLPKVALACVLFGFGCGASQGTDTTEPAAPTAPAAESRNDPADVAAIKTLLSDTYGSVVMAHDVEAYSKLYSDDAIWAAPDAPDRTGPADIQAGIKVLFDKFKFEVTPQPQEIEVRGDFAYAFGIVDGVLTPRAGGDKVKIQFRILWLLRREGNGWKIFRQIWNKKPV